MLLRETRIALSHQALATRKYQDELEAQQETGK
jgi:hypothetical protein